MKTHSLNYTASKELYESVKNGIEPKQCYRNVWYSVTRRFKELEGCKIAYGYMQSLDNLYVRHCFFVDKEDKVIDPTIFCFKHTKEPEYVSFALLTFEEYAKLLKKNHYYPDLCAVLREEDAAAIQEGFKKGLLFIG